MMDLEKLTEKFKQLQEAMVKVILSQESDKSKNSENQSGDEN